MKYRIFRLLGVITVLTLLLAVIPAMPALAAETIVLSPSQAKIGDRINFSGGGYTGSGDTLYYLDIYISDQQAIVNNIMNTTVTRYKKTVFGALVEDNGTYSGSFLLPASLDEGTLGTTTPLSLTAGVSYFVYSCNRYSNPAIPGTVIKAVTTITVTPGASLDALNPSSGAPGSTVTITGINWPVNTALTILMDGAAITPTSGATTTASGIIFTTIVIPTGAASGAHTITVTAGSSTVTATLTVTAPATLALSPNSGAAGTQVAASGANFASGAISVTFDGAAIAISGGSTTTSGGVFASPVHRHLHGAGLDHTCLDHTNLNHTDLDHACDHNQGQPQHQPERPLRRCHYRHRRRRLYSELYSYDKI
jgi:hypothetical protein